MVKCKICNINEAGPNGYVCEHCLKEAAYRPKVTVLAQGSAEHDWGIATIALSVISDEEPSELAGVWNKSAAGDIQLFLIEPIKALSDRSTLILAELVARREKGLPLTGPYKEKVKKLTGGTGVKKPRVRKEETGQDASTFIIAQMQELRKRLHPQA